MLPTYYAITMSHWTLKACLKEWGLRRWGNYSSTLEGPIYQSRVSDLKDFHVTITLVNFNTWPEHHQLADKQPPVSIVEFRAPLQLMQLTLAQPALDLLGFCPITNLKCFPTLFNNLIGCCVLKYDVFCETVLCFGLQGHHILEFNCTFLVMPTWFKLESGLFKNKNIMGAKLTANFSQW